MTRLTPPAPTTDLPDGYRMTELGPLPEAWQVVRLGEVTQLVRGISWSKKEQSPDGIPVIAIPNIREGRVSFDIRYRVAKKISAAKQLYEGDILLVGSSGSPHNVGRTAIVQGLPFRQATFASFLVKVIPLDKTERDYIYYLLGSQVVDFVRCSKRAADGKYNLQVRALKEHLIPLPLLPEQRAIAHVLRAVQDAREVTARVIAALRDLKRSLMRHLFTYGPVPVGATGRSPLQQTDIGPIPAHWRVVRLGEVATTTSGGTPNRNDPGNFGGSIPWLKSGELQDSPILASEEYLTEYGLRHSNAKVFPKGSLLIAMYGATAGKVGILEVEAATNQAICAILPENSNTLSWYLFYALIYRREDLKAQRYGGAQPNLSQRAIRSFKVPLPPLAEQRQIARILQTVDRKIAAEEAHKEALDDLFRSLLHHLMTAKIRLPQGFVQRFEE